MEALWLADESSPIRSTTVGGILREAATAAADRPAVVAWSLDPGPAPLRLSYAELLSESERAARALLTRFEPGERVAIWSNNSAEWLLLEFGCALAGLVMVTVNPGYRARELAYVLEQSGAAGLFHARAFRGNPMADSVAEVRPQLPGLREVVCLDDFPAFLSTAPENTELPEVRPQDPAQIQYTSGTTGFPKGALLHHLGVTNNARFVMERFGSDHGCGEGAVFAHGMPFFHAAGCAIITLGAVQVRAAQALLPAFDPGRLLEMVEAEHATLLGGVPTMLLAMIQHPQMAKRDLSSVRGVVSGGSTVPAELVRAIEARLRAPLCIVYGQTEASPVITMARPVDSAEDKATTLGQPLPQTEVKIADAATGLPVAVDETGELCTRGYLVMTGYFDNPEATATTIDGDGWLHTGDLAAMDARGYCRIRGRLKELVIRGGENLFPVEVENVLYEHADVADVAVIGVPDALMGEELAAFVRLVEPAKADGAALRAHVRARLAAQKTPRYWVFVGSFPLTGSGKVQKFELRRQWEAGEFADSVWQKPVV